MCFHFEYEGYLRKVYGFRVISKKTAKMTFFTFFLLHHEILLANFRFGFSTPKNILNRKNQNFPGKNTI